MRTVFREKKISPEMVFLFLISALVFLPYAPRLTYYLDDWYYIYDGYVAGANIFHSMFDIDRPARGYFFDIYFSLFGAHPFPYHVSAYLWRMLAGLGALQLFNILWRKNREFNFLAALLFVLYPGYFWWISAIEYQPMIASLALQVFSVLLTLMAVQATGTLRKIIFSAAAILTGWTYIALVDYAIGMEAFRFLCVYLLVYQREQILTSSKKIFLATKVWAWNAIIPCGFIFWRLFLFENSRRATDVNLILARFREAPMNSLGNWLISLYQSAANVAFNSWFKQFYLQFADAGFEISFLGYAQAAGVVVLLVILARRFVNAASTDEHRLSTRIPQEAICLGGTSLLIGALPVVLTNRFVNLTIYSHYGLPASLASAVFIVGLVYFFFSSKLIRTAWALVLITIAVLTHSLIAEKTIILEDATEEFWWQVHWRIPDLRPDTTLVTLYPHTKMVDNDLGLMEPVNMIYFPGPQNENPIRYFVSTLMPTDENTHLILSMHSKRIERYRTHETVMNYGNILVLVQPTPQTCVRVIDGAYYIVSQTDIENIKSLAPYSKVENIRLQGNAGAPQEFAFGREPDHGWCYFFEKADLAVQNRDWESAAKLGAEVLALGLYPSDQVEWFPFIQAYAMLGDENKLRMISEQTESNVFFEEQVCRAFRRPNSILAFDSRIRNTVENLFCH